MILIPCKRWAGWGMSAWQTLNTFTFYIVTIQRVSGSRVQSVPDIVYLYLLVDLFFYLFFICHSSAACIEIPPAIHRLTTCQSGTDRDAKGVCECVCVERNWRQQVKFRVHSACLIELSCCLVSKQCPASQMSGLVTWVRLRFCLCEYVCVCVSVCLCLLSWCLSAHSFVRCIKPVYRNTRLKANHRQLHSDLTILPTHPFLFSLPPPCPPPHPSAPSLPTIVLGP